MSFRTLILEDDENTRRLLSLLLGKRGHQVVSYDSPLHCPNLDWATCKCSKDTPCFDFLISDNIMPGMTGLKFLEIQTLRGCRLDSTRKALMSGLLLDQEKRTAARLDCRVFEKPIRWGEFYHWLEEGEARSMGAAS